MKGLPLLPLLLLIALAVPPQSAAVQQTVWRVSHLSSGPPAVSPGARTTSRGEVLRALAEDGFGAGKNVELVDWCSQRRVDEYAARILLGAAAAARLGLCVPPTLLARADEVIE